MHFEVRQAELEKNGYWAPLTLDRFLCGQALCSSPRWWLEEKTAGMLRVVASVLNVRGAPGLKGVIKFQAAAGTLLTKGEEKTVTADGIEWIPVVVWVAKESTGGKFIDE